MRRKRFRGVPSATRDSAKAMNPPCMSCGGTAVAMRLMQAIVRIAPPAVSFARCSSIDSLSCESSPDSKHEVIQLQLPQRRHDKEGAGWSQKRKRYEALMKT